MSEQDATTVARGYFRMVFKLASVVMDVADEESVAITYPQALRLAQNGLGNKLEIGRSDEAEGETE